MFMAMAQDIRVIIIKLFDRLNNLNTLHVLSTEKQKRIARETLEIFAPVADRLGMGNIKLELEDAAFKYAHPEEYQWILEETREKIPEREAYLSEKVIPILKKELKKENIPVIDIKHRAKNYYSLWRKLLRNNMDWYLIYDLTAVRILVESIEDCYVTLGVIHKLWKPLPGRIKDYISLPKQNGYKSLHTTVFCVDRKVTEFQIRTPQMHQEAEQGIAAHWAWEMAGKPKQTRKMPHQKFAWINQLQDWHQKLNNQLQGKEFLESLKIDFFKNRVFVLTPQGDIIDLPEGATPVDFAYHIHSEVGNSATAAKVNNRIVSFSHELASGDIVEILTQKGKKPTQKMLECAKTSLAKNHIRSALKKEGKVPLADNKAVKRPKAELNIVAEDRIGMLRDISSIFSTFRINIESLITKEADNKYTAIQIVFSPKNKEQVGKLTTRLKKIKGVEEVGAQIKEK
jgi:GTP pyrophosphokinase